MRDWNLYIAQIFSLRKSAEYRKGLLQGLRAGDHISQRMWERWTDFIWIDKNLAKRVVEKIKERLREVA